MLPMTSEVQQLYNLYNVGWHAPFQHNVQHLGKLCILGCRNLNYLNGLENDNKEI